MQDLLPKASALKNGSNASIAKEALPKREKTEADKWAEKWSKPLFEAYWKSVMPSMPPLKATKLQLAELLLAAGQVMPIIPSSKLSCMVKKLKVGLDEPLELLAEPVASLGLGRIVGTDLAVDSSIRVVGSLVDSSMRAIGPVVEGTLVNLAPNHVEIAMGLRLPLDMFAIKRERAIVDKIDEQDEESDDEELQ